MDSKTTNVAEINITSQNLRTRS